MSPAADIADRVGLRRALLWRSLTGLGLEYCGLWRYPMPGSPGANGWALRGTAVAEFGGVPAEVRYRVVCNPSWPTRRVHVGLVRGAGKAAVRLEADGAGRWLSGGREVPEYEGSLDVDPGDRGFRQHASHPAPEPGGGRSGRDRCGLGAVPRSLAGAAAPAVLAEDGYRYESLDSGFTAELIVDELGLIVHYSGWCERVASYDPVPAASE